jgi:hypothetical protein
MTAFLIACAVSGLTSWVAVTLVLNYRRARHEGIQAPATEALWLAGEELRRDLRPCGGPGER